METLIVNWMQGIKGGCESHADEIAQFIGGRVVDINTAMKAIGTEAASKDYYPYCTVERSIILSRYIKEYLKRFPLKAAISMDFCLAPSKSDVPTVAVSGNPYSDIALFLGREGLYDEFKMNEFGYAYTWMQGQQFANADKIVAVSPYMQGYIKALGFDSTVIEHGVDLRKFKPQNKEKCREELGLPLDKTIVVCPTKFTPVKGWHITAELIKRNPGVHWLVIFSHPVAHVPSLPNVTIHSNLSHSKMPVCYGAADLYMLPSCVEGFNRTAIEALACGLPIITQKTGAFHNVMGGGATDQDGVITDYGIIITRWNANAYHKALKHWLENRDSFKGMRKLVTKRWNIKGKAKQWQRLIKSL